MTELTKEEEKVDWYGVLGLDIAADDGAISKAFKKLSLKWHPDKNQGSQDAHDMFMRVKEAKNFLLDAKKRKIYDDKRVERLRMESLLVSLFLLKIFWARPPRASYCITVSKSTADLLLCTLAVRLDL